jgi:hypothetical protein
MKHEFSKAALARAARIARKSGHRQLAAVIAGRGSIEDELFAAARRGDEAAITRLLGLELKVGDRMPDGTIYAGVSPDSGKRLFAAAADAPRLMTFKDANHYAQTLEAHGHKDWRLPMRAELTNLFNNRIEIGGFTMKPGSGNARWYCGNDRCYWSCTEEPRNAPSGAWGIDFMDGDGSWYRKDTVPISSRLVRAEP